MAINVIQLYKIIISCIFFISFKHNFHVDAESMIVLKRVKYKRNICKIFDCTARKFFRKEDLSIFIDHMKLLR